MVNVPHDEGSCCCKKKRPIELVVSLQEGNGLSTALSQLCQTQSKWKGASKCVVNIIKMKQRNKAPRCSRSWQRLPLFSTGPGGSTWWQLTALLLLNVRAGLPTSTLKYRGADWEAAALLNCLVAMCEGWVEPDKAQIVHDSHHGGFGTWQISVVISATHLPSHSDTLLRFLWHRPPTPAKAPRTPKKKKDRKLI